MGNQLSGQSFLVDPADPLRAPAPKIMAGGLPQAKRERCREYHAAHREDIRARRAAYRLANHDKVLGREGAE